MKLYWKIILTVLLSVIAISPIVVGIALNNLCGLCIAIVGSLLTIPAVAAIIPIAIWDNDNATYYYVDHRKY